jgi:hypothetical protein
MSYFIDDDDLNDLIDHEEYAHDRGHRNDDDLDTLMRQIEDVEISHDTQNAPRIRKDTFAEIDDLLNHNLDGGGRDSRHDTFDELPKHKKSSSSSSSSSSDSDDHFGGKHTQNTHGHVNTHANTHANTHVPTPAKAHANIHDTHTTHATTHTNTHAHAKPVGHHHGGHDDLDDLILENKSHQDKAHAAPAQKRIVLDNSDDFGSAPNQQAQLKGVPAGVEAVIRSHVSGTNHYIILEGTPNLVQSVMAHLKSTGNWTPAGSNQMINTKQETLQNLYKYLFRVLHKCKIGKIKWNYNIDHTYKQIEEIQLWN